MINDETILGSIKSVQDMQATVARLHGRRRKNSTKYIQLLKKSVKIQGNFVPIEDLLEMKNGARSQPPSPSYSRDRAAELLKLRRRFSEREIVHGKEKVPYYM